MARYIGPVCKLCRREGAKLFLKGERCYSEKCAFTRRPYPPGQHGQGRVKLSEYAVRLREKQKVRRIYGVLVRHGHVKINGKRVDIPSYTLRVGQKLELTPGAQKFKLVAASIAASEKRNPASWLEVDKGTFSLSVKAPPPREDLNEP